MGIKELADKLGHIESLSGLSQDILRRKTVERDLDEVGIFHLDGGWAVERGGIAGLSAKGLNSIEEALDMAEKFRKSSVKSFRKKYGLKKGQNTLSARKDKIAGLKAKLAEKRRKSWKDY